MNLIKFTKLNKRGRTLHYGCASSLEDKKMKRILLIMTSVVLFLLMSITVNAQNKYEIAKDTYYELFDQLETIG